MASAAIGPVGVAVRQAPAEGRSYIGATIRPSIAAHIHYVSDALGYPSSSDFFRAAIAHFAETQKTLLTDAAAAESLAQLATITNEIRGRKATRLVQQQAATAEAG
jgi:hypothetical protein